VPATEPVFFKTNETEYAARWSHRAVELPTTFFGFGLPAAQFASRNVSTSEESLSAGSLVMDRLEYLKVV